MIIKYSKGNMEIKVCTGKKCSGRFSSYILERIQNDKEKFRLDFVELYNVPCLGGCGKGPNILINGEKHSGMNPAKTSELLFKKLKNEKDVTNKKHKNKKTGGV